MKRGSGCCAVDIYCTAALTSLPDSVSYITFLFSEWRIRSDIDRPTLFSPFFEDIQIRVSDSRLHISTNSEPNEISTSKSKFGC